MRQNYIYIGYNESVNYGFILFPFNISETRLIYFRFVTLTPHEVFLLFSSGKSLSFP